MGKKNFKNADKNISYECLLCSKDCEKHVIAITLLNPSQVSLK